ncbi:MAG: hypothetical protein V1721_04095 [Pseudomonadota bacterium]
MKVKNEVINDTSTGSIHLTVREGNWVLESLTRAFVDSGMEAANIKGPGMIKSEKSPESGGLRFGKFGVHGRKYGKFHVVNGECDITSFEANIMHKRDTNLIVMHIHMNYTDVTENKRGLEKLVSEIFNRFCPSMNYVSRGGHVMIEMKDNLENIPDTGTRYKNDFKAYPTVEFTLERQAGIERKPLSDTHPGCPVAIIVAKLPKPPTSP